MDKRGYFGIGMYQPKFEDNLGTLFRSAQFLDARFIYTIGARYTHHPADTGIAKRHVPYFAYNTFTDFKAHLPEEGKLIGIEMTETASDLETFVHPERAIYLLGGEAITLPPDILQACAGVVKFTSKHSLNVAVAGSIVLYDRHVKQILREKGIINATPTG